jgi:DoxX-like protein
MDALPLLPLLIWSLAAIFGSIGLIHIFGPRFLRNAFETWNYGARMRMITGLFEVAVAVMLIDPEMRMWGIAIAGVIMFAAMITLLNHEQYLCAIPSFALMIALIPASLAVPSSESEFRFATVQAVGDSQIASAAPQAVVGTVKTASLDSE